MLSYVFLLALLAPALVSATEGIRSCSGGKPTPTSVVLAGCSTTPCDVTQGTEAIISFDFRTSGPANLLRPLVMATALGATIEYTLPPAHQIGCNHLTVGSCPLSANEDATYLFVFPITPIYPPIPVTVEFTAFNHNNETVFCSEIDIRVRLRN